MPLVGSFCGTRHCQRSFQQKLHPAVKGPRRVSWLFTTVTGTPMSRSFTCGVYGQFWKPITSLRASLAWPGWWPGWLPYYEIRRLWLWTIGLAWFVSACMNNTAKRHYAILLPLLSGATGGFFHYRWWAVGIKRFTSLESTSWDCWTGTCRTTLYVLMGNCAWFLAWESRHQ